MTSLRSNMRMRVLLPTALLALAGIGVGAFAFSGTPGGSEEPLPPIARPQTQEQPEEGKAGVALAAWRKKANAVCRTLNDSTAELPTPQSRTELLATLPASLDLAETALTELRALEVPKKQAKQIARMLAKFDRFVVVERQAVEALTADNSASFASLTGEAFAANDAGSRIARELAQASAPSARPRTLSLRRSSGSTASSSPSSTRRTRAWTR